MKYVKEGQVEATVNLKALPLHPSKGSGPHCSAPASCVCDRMCSPWGQTVPFFPQEKLEFYLKPLHF